MEQQIASLKSKNVKEYNSGRGGQAKVWDKAWSCHALRAPLSPHLILTNPEALQTYFGFLWRLHCLGGGVDYITGHWLLIQLPAPFPSLRSHGWFG